MRHTRFDECVYFNEVMAKVIPELVFIDDFPCTIHTFETDILDISSRKIAPRISPNRIMHPFVGQLYRKSKKSE